MELLVCSLCQKSFKWQSGLSRHTKVFHKDSTCVCTVCGGMFKREDNLKRHMVSCSIEKANTKKCNICSKQYECKTTLMQHIRSSHEATVYPCEKCGKCFTQKINLEIHVKNYSCKTNNTFIKCIICDKT